MKHYEVKSDSQLKVSHCHQAVEGCARFKLDLDREEEFYQDRYSKTGQVNIVKHK